ncbi:MAG: hypothetical protein AAGC55_02120, partial [Myxococcota bacterium]
DRHGAERISFDYSATERNGPLREFLTQITGGLDDPSSSDGNGSGNGSADRANGAVSVTRARFFAELPPLYSTTEERSDG